MTTNIDNKLVEFTVDGFRASWESSGSIDQGEFQLRFKDENRVEIATVSSGLESITPALTWVPRTFTSAVPATTRFIDVILHGYRLAGSNCDGYFDQITARSVVQ